MTSDEFVQKVFEFIDSIASQLSNDGYLEGLHEISDDCRIRAEAVEQEIADEEHDD